MDTSVAYDDVVPTWPGEQVDAGGMPMFVRRAESLTAGAEPAVFVHGLGGGSASWADLMALVRGRCEGYAPDLPGFGYSPPPPDGAYSVVAQAAAVTKFVQHLGGPVHLFGTSLGGTVAVRVAADRPELVCSLTLICPALPHLRPRRATAGLLLPLLPFVGPAVMRQAGRITPDEQARQVLHGLAGNPDRLHPQRLAEAAAEIAAAAGRPHVADAYLGALRGIVAAYLTSGSGGVWAAAHRIRVPTLAVFGTADPIVDPRLAARTARSFRDSRVLVVGGVGHLAHLEAPAVVADAFLSLLNG